MTPSVSLIFSKEQQPTLTFSRPNFLKQTKPIPANIHQVTFREATVSDLGDILRLFKQTILNTCHKHYTPTQLRVWTASVQDAAKWLHRIENDYFLVAEIDDRIVGMCSLQNGEYVDIMFVHHEFQRQGIAKQLMEAIISRAEVIGSKHIYTDASITAKPFFNQFNFKALRANQNIIGDQILINYRMEKGL